MFGIAPCNFVRCVLEVMNAPNIDWHLAVKWKGSAGRHCFPVKVLKNLDE